MRFLAMILASCLVFGLWQLATNCTGEMDPEDAAGLLDRISALPPLADPEVGLVPATYLEDHRYDEPPAGYEERLAERGISLLRYGQTYTCRQSYTLGLVNFGLNGRGPDSGLVDNIVRSLDCAIERNDLASWGVRARLVRVRPERYRYRVWKIENERFTAFLQFTEPAMDLEQTGRLSREQIQKAIEDGARADAPYPFDATWDLDDDEIMDVRVTVELEVAIPERIELGDDHGGFSGQIVINSDPGGKLRFHLASDRQHPGVRLQWGDAGGGPPYLPAGL
jgi:hypothetical protein